MRTGRPTILVAAALLCAGFDGCGRPASKPAFHVQPHSTSPTGDGDPDDALNRSKGLFDRDDRVFVKFGRAATAGEQRAVRETLVRYYAAAAADDGQDACGAVYSLTAETLAEAYGHLPSVSGLAPGVCPVAFSELFRRARGLYAHKPATALHLDRFRVDGPRGIAFVDFGTGAIRMMPVHLQGGSWKVREVVDLTLG